MSFFKRIFLLIVLFACLSPSLGAEESPEALFQKWVSLAAKGDVDGVIALSSAAKRKEAQESMKTMPHAQMALMLKAMNPDSYKVLNQTVSKDQKKASLFIEGVVTDLFTLKGEKPKKVKEKAEIRLVKEDGQWKMDQQCWGMEGKCEKGEESAQSASWGKKIPLKGGATVTFLRGREKDFSNVKVQGKPAAVELVFEANQENPTLNYFLHKSPSFADFYYKLGDQKVPPTAVMEEKESASLHEAPKKEVKILEEGTSYSRSRTFSGKTSFSILFDLPKDATGPQSFWANFTVADQKYGFKLEN
ncbi:MAG: hypothetical protein U1F57_03365 [bacterium]